MKKSAPVGIAQVLSGVLDSAGLGHLLHEDRLRRNWEAVMGSRAMAVASLEGFKDYILKVRVESATWRMELHYQRDAIRMRANGILGADLVKEVVLL